VKEMASVQTKQNPLDTLVISQLSALRQREAALRLRLLSATPSEPTIANELWSLQASADRLSRMIDAMGLSATQGSSIYTSPFAA
jgi:hypothetical protein